MKTLITITYYIPNISGLTIYAQRLAEELVKKGHQVTVLTSRHDNLLIRQEIINGVRVKRSFVLGKLGKGVIMPFLALEALGLVKRADVVNCHLPQPEAFWSLFFGRILGKRAVVTYQCDVKLPPGLGNFLTEKALLVSNFLNCLLAEKIVSTSWDYAQHSPLLRQFLKKIKVIYPPIKDFTQIGENKNFRKRMSTYREKYKIGFVGRLATDKGIEYLLNSVPFLREKLNTFGIFLVGPKKPIGEKTYQNQISQLSRRYKNNVFFLGRLSEEELSAFFQSVDVLVLPSINSTEAFGMVQVESMLCGVPVIVSDLPGIRVPIKLTGMGEIVPAKDSKALAQAIVKILKNKKSYIKPKREIEEIFNFQKTINRYEELCK